MFCNGLIVSDLYFHLLFRSIFKIGMKSEDLNFPVSHNFIITNNDSQSDILVSYQMTDHCFLFPLSTTNNNISFYCCLNQISIILAAQRLDDKGQKTLTTNGDQRPPMRDSRPAPVVHGQTYLQNFDPNDWSTTK